MTDNFRFHIDGRVRFCETDLQGVLHHSEYLRYFEAGRVEYLRQLGLIEKNDFKGPATVALVEALVNFTKPLKFDDPYRLFLGVTKISGATITFEYRMVGKDDPATVATGKTVLASVDRKSFKPLRVPDILKSAIVKFERL